MLGLPTAGCFVASHWKTCTFTHPALEAPRCTSRSCAPLLPASDSQNSINAQHTLPPRSAAQRWRCCATARVEIGSATAESALEQWAAASGITSPNLRVADFGGECLLSCSQSRPSSLHNTQQNQTCILESRHCCSKLSNKTLAAPKVSCLLGAGRQLRCHLHWFFFTKPGLARCINGSLCITSPTMAPDCLALAGGPPPPGQPQVPLPYLFVSKLIMSWFGTCRAARDGSHCRPRSGRASGVAADERGAAGHPKAALPLPRLLLPRLLRLQTLVRASRPPYTLVCPPAVAADSPVCCRGFSDAYELLPPNVYMFTTLSTSVLCYARGQIVCHSSCLLGLHDRL